MVVLTALAALACTEARAQRSVEGDSVAPRRMKRITATARQRRPPLRGIYIPVVAEPGQIVVFGQMATPTPCYHLAGTAERMQSVIHLLVQARPTGEECAPGTLGASTYKVTVRRLPAGTYVLRVIHAYGDDAWRPSVVSDTSVVVP